MAGAPASRFIAQSRAMRALVGQVQRFARTDSNVLITGETGTGKNAIAHELHVRGPRAKRPYVVVDCASLSSSLIDSELFGHERGAFTDAVAARAGRFELAANGTVYLDAVTELPVEAQGKLLRIVEEKRVERLGGHASFAVAARIVASADARIEDAVRDATFRHDLYHRLRVLPIFVPPLRERPEDILPLTRYFLKRAAAAAERAVPALTRDATAALRDYAWPGNVRELQHTIARAFEAADGGTLTLTHLPAEVLEAPAVEPAESRTRRPTLDDIERRYIAATLKHARGNQTEAAKILGISRKSLWEKRKRYGLE
jgi:DNA-binding NtrC family response regulator